MKKIKEVIRITGLSRRTLQYYDDCGLVKPNRTAENYRLYGEDELKRLWNLLIYKEMRFRLDEIAVLLDVSEEEVQSKLEAQLDRINHKIYDLERIRNLIKKVLEYGMPDVISAERTVELSNYKDLVQRLAEKINRN